MATPYDQEAKARDLDPLTRYDVTPILAGRVKRRREHLGLTQEALARSLGTSQGGLSALEAGKRAEIRARDIWSLETVLGDLTVPSPEDAVAESMPDSGAIPEKSQEDIPRGPVFLIFDERLFEEYIW